MKTDKAIEAVMSEYEFVVSLIRMYREFQMQAVGFSIVLYTAVLGLIGSALETNKLIDVASHTTALLPFLVAIVVLAFTVMEVRIRRASLYTTNTLLPRLYQLLGLPEGEVLLEFERAPSAYLTRFQKVFAHSGVFVLLIGLPAVGAAIWHMMSTAIPADHAHPYVAGTGTAVLFVAGIVSAVTSARAELRDLRVARGKAARPALLADGGGA